MTETATETSVLDRSCEVLRELHSPGSPRCWPCLDVASARSVAAAGFPVVGTTSAGGRPRSAAEDHQERPRTRCSPRPSAPARSVPVPVTVDAEAGYGLEPRELVAALQSAGAAGCNLEDTDHDAGALRDSDEQAEWLAAVRAAAWERNYGLVINARVDMFLPSAPVPGSSTWWTRPSSCPGPTCRPGPTASIRARCGSPRRWAPSSAGSRVR